MTTYDDEGKETDGCGNADDHVAVEVGRGEACRADADEKQGYVLNIEAQVAGVYGKVYVYILQPRPGGKSRPYSASVNFDAHMPRNTITFQKTPEEKIEILWKAGESSVPGPLVTLTPE